MEPQLIGIEAETITLPVDHHKRWSVVSSQRWLHIHNGRLKIEGPDGESRVGSGALVLVPIGLRHRVRVIGKQSVTLDLLRVRNRCLAPSHGVDRLGVQFLRTLAEYAKANAYRLPLPPGPRLWIQESMTRLSTLAKQGNAGMAMQMKGEFLSLLGRLSGVKALQDIDVPKGPLDSSWKVRQVLSYIDDHFDEPISINQAAAIAGQGRTRFIASFKAGTGMTFAAYLTKVRLERAAHYLKNSRRDILDIAFGCGFGSVSRFYESFKQEFAVSPAKFRRS